MRKIEFENPKCSICGRTLEVVEYDENDAVVLHCRYCGATETYFPCDEDEEENYPYYNKDIDQTMGSTSHGYDAICPLCGSIGVIWQSDFMLSDITGHYDDDNDALMPTVYCPHCGGNIEILYPTPNQIKENEYPYYFDDEEN